MINDIQLIQVKLSKLAGLEEGNFADNLKKTVEWFINNCRIKQMKKKEIIFDLRTATMLGPASTVFWSLKYYQDLGYKKLF